MKPPRPLVRFGLITDLHYARRRADMNPYYDQSLDEAEGQGSGLYFYGGGSGSCN
jgi:hypothetical protein